VLETMKKLLPIILILLLATSLVFAADITLFDWQRYNKAEPGNPIASSFSGSWIPASNYTIAIGDKMQPIIVDIDNDGIKEAYILDGSTIVSLQYNNGALSIYDEKVIAGTLDSLQAYKNGSNNFIFVENSSDYFILNSTLDIVFNASFDTSCAIPASKVKCTDSLESSAVCIFASTNTTSIISLTDYSCTDLYVYANYNFKDSYPAISDIESDGDYEVAWITDTDADNDWDLTLIDYDSGSVVWTHEYAPLATTTYAYDPIIKDLNGANEEIMYSYVGRTDAGSDTYNVGVRIIKSDGNAYAYQPQTTFSGTDYAYADVGGYVVNSIVDNDNTLDNILCFAKAAYTGFSGIKSAGIKCMNVNDGTTLFDDVDYFGTSYPGYTNYIYEGSLSLVDIDGDIYYDLLTPKGIISFSGATNYTFGSNYAPVIAADYDGDEIPELTMSDGTTFTVMSSSAQNLKPELNQSLEGAGYTGYYSSPVCLDTTLTFKARDSFSYSPGNYINDVSSDTERIVTNCGQAADGTPTSSYTSDTENGTYDANTPTFSCVYNMTGLFSIRLYLQDEANDNDFTEYNDNDIVINVIDGIEGDTCNHADGYVDAIDSLDVDTPDGSQDVDDDIARLFDILLGTSTALKFIVGMAIMIAIIIMTAQYTSNAVVMLFSGILGLIIVTFLGLVPAYLLILIIIIALIGIVFSKLVFGGSE